MPKRTSFPFDVPARLGAAGSEIYIPTKWGNPPPVQSDVRRPVRRRREAASPGREATPVEAAPTILPKVFVNAAGTSTMVNISRNFCKWRGVLIGMSPACVEESPTIRSQILDDLQRCYRTLRYDLLRTFDGSGDGIACGNSWELPARRAPRPLIKAPGNRIQSRARVRSTQKLPSVVGELPGETADKGNAHG